MFLVFETSIITLCRIYGMMQNVSAKWCLKPINSNGHLRQFLSVSKYMYNQSHIRIKEKNLENGFFFYLSELTCFGRSCRLQMLFCTTLIWQNRHFQVCMEMFVKYSSLEYGEFILAFQLQFGTYEAESEHFRWEKEKRHFNEWRFQDK